MSADLTGAPFLFCFPFFLSEWVSINNRALHSLAGPFFSMKKYEECLLKVGGRVWAWVSVCLFAAQCVPEKSAFSLWLNLLWFCVIFLFVFQRKSLCASSPHFCELFFSWPFDLLVDSLIDQFLIRLFHWLIDRSIDWLIDWLIDGLIDCWCDWLIVRWIDWLMVFYVREILLAETFLLTVRIFCSCSDWLWGRIPTREQQGSAVSFPRNFKVFRGTGPDGGRAPAAVGGSVGALQLAVATPSLRIRVVPVVSRRGQNPRRYASIFIFFSIKHSKRVQINQPIQPINQSINQPINWSINQSIDQLIDQPINQSVNQSGEPSNRKLINQSTKRTNGQEKTDSQKWREETHKFFLRNSDKKIVEFQLYFNPPFVLLHLIYNSSVWFQMILRCVF